MDVLLIKQEVENKFKLVELLKDTFKVRVTPKNDLISDIFHPKTNTQLVFNPEAIQDSRILLLHMSDCRLVSLSKDALLKGFEIKLYWDRFDLAHVIKKILVSQSNNDECDPIKLISLMTWESQTLPENDCKIVFNHFKSVENMFNLSKDALEFSLKSLSISEKSKQVILTFLTSGQDYYID